MAIGLRNVTVLLLFLLVFVVGGVLLQIYLSRRESRWPGLVLSSITFLFSLVAILNVVRMGSAAEVIATLLMVVITFNIPTLILLAIYFACRSGRKKKSEIDKMNIDDL